MNDQNDLALHQQFPALYRPARVDPTGPHTTCIGLFFECGDGWFNLIRRLSSGLSDFMTAAGNDIQVVQVKEKHGRLRVYVDGGGDEIQALLDAAEEESGHICGAAGSLSVAGWRATRCWAHHLVP